MTPLRSGRRRAGHVGQGYVVGVGPIYEGGDALRPLAIDDDQAGAAGGDGDVGGRDRGPPRADRIGGSRGVLEAVGDELAQRRLAARDAGEDVPAARGVREGGGEEGVIAGGGYGRPSISAGVARMSVRESTILFRS